MLLIINYHILCKLGNGETHRGLTAGIGHPHDIWHDMHQEKIIGKFLINTNKYYIHVPPSIQQYLHFIFDISMTKQVWNQYCHIGFQ